MSNIIPIDSIGIGGESPEGDGDSNINPCLMSGCDGACCVNSDIEMTFEEWEKFNPKNLPFRKVNSRQEITAISDNFDPRIHGGGGRYVYIDQANRIVVVFNSQLKCPNYEYRKGCTNYKNAPAACRKFVFKGDKCRVARRLELHDQFNPGDIQEM